jgi:hypothetical protein
MSAQSISPAFTTFQDIDGQPLEGGMIYIGTAGLAAATNQITVYWDSALTSAVTQPIRTTGGYPMNSGTPGVIYTGASDFSIAVNDKNNSVIYSALTRTIFNGSMSTSSMSTIPLSGIDGECISISAFYTDLDGGGGMFVWDSDGDKATHDGGTIIDPVVAREYLTGTAISTGYFTAGAGVGVWKRVYDGSIEVKWFGARGDNSANDSPSFQQAISKFPSTDILVSGVDKIFRLEEQILVPNSASFHLKGNSGIQTTTQVTVFCAYNGPLFLAAGTVFCGYSNLRFLSNSTTYPLSQGILHSGESVYSIFSQLTFDNFGGIALETVGATNVCRFETILGRNSQDYVMDVKNCVASNFDGLVVDNNFAGGFAIQGASCDIKNLYSEDSCKLNVTAGATFREFVFSGGTFNIGPISLNSFAGNPIDPIVLTSCNNTVLSCVRQLSAVTPSYSYEIDNGNSGASAFLLLGSLRTRIKYPNQNVTIIDTGFASGGYDPIVSVDGVEWTPEEGTWTPAFVNIGTGTYAIQLGSYSKFGKLVYASCNLQLATLGTASGSVQVTGLPFVINATESPSTSSIVTVSWSVAPTAICGTGVPGSSLVNILNGGAGSGSQMSDLGGSGLITFDIVYRVD